MEAFVAILRTVAVLGALFCVAAYVYGYVFKRRGNRRLHTASLLFSGLALANVAVLIPKVATPATMVAGVNLVVFLLLAVVFQSVTAFRGRAGDRRADDRRADDRRAPNQAAVERQASPAA